MEAKSRVRDFLSRRGMFHGDIDLAQCTEAFLGEMEDGLAGRPSSLQMIPTFIEADGEIPLGRPVVAVDAGGTHLRVAVVHFQEGGKPVLASYRKHPMPGLCGPISSDGFFAALAHHLRELTTRADSLGLSFSFPAEILPNKDGRVVRLCKEMQVDGISGQLLGERLNAALGELRAGRSLRVVVLNDTVGALLAGRAANSSRGRLAYAGFVLGTGTNCSYVESNDKIRKRRDLKPGARQIVNVESGAYAGAPRGKIDLDFDASTADPGKYVFEKAFSGAYLGALALRTLREMARTGLFSPKVTARLEGHPRLETSDLDAFLGGPDTGSGLHGEFRRDGTSSDLGIACETVDLLVERAAKLASISLGATLLRGRSAAASPEEPVCVTAEGSTLYGLRSLRERLVVALESILRARVPYRLVAVDHAPLVGAAVAGLTN